MVSDAAEDRPPEQLRYATLLDWGARLGFAVLVVAFGAYVTGVLTAHVPHERLPELWTLPLDAYIAETGTPTGWDWIALLAKGEFASIAGIAILSACSLPCLAAIVPIYRARGERVLAAIVVLTILVQLLAASGLLVAGH
jgi:hypothetical protein